jgi:hypothetical protein
MTLAPKLENWLSRKFVKPFPVPFRATKRLAPITTISVVRLVRMRLSLKASNEKLKISIRFI